MRRRHDRLSIAFHWATLAILLLGFASIESRALFEPGSAMRMRIMEWHYLLGLLVLMMTLARLYHRVTRGRVPAITPALPAWADILSHAMHYALYATLLALPVLGLLTVSLQGDPLHLGFGLALPRTITSCATTRCTGFCPPASAPGDRAGDRAHPARQRPTAAKAARSAAHRTRPGRSRP
jgi:cytochrome b561